MILKQINNLARQNPAKRGKLCNPRATGLRIKKVAVKPVAEIVPDINNDEGKEPYMPQQEVFFEEQAGDRFIAVLKTYDRSYAREVFGNVDEAAIKSLAAALEIVKNYEPQDIPTTDGPDYEDFLWEELSEASLEDVRQSPRLYSFFVVTETKAGKAKDLYISADWPSAEEFASRRLADAS